MALDKAARRAGTIGPDQGQLIDHSARGLVCFPNTHQPAPVRSECGVGITHRNALRRSGCQSLSPGTVVRGVVVVGATGEPVVGATVTRFTNHQPISRYDTEQTYRRMMARTDSNGRFELRDVPPGEMRLAVEHPEWPSVTDGPIDVAVGGELASRHIEVSAGAALRGRVLSFTGGPIGNETMRLTAIKVDQGVRREWQTESDVNGEFRFDKLSEGLYRVSLVVRKERASIAAIHTAARVVSSGTSVPIRGFHHERTARAWLERTP